MPKKRSRTKHAVKAELHVPGLSKAGSSLNLQIYASRLKLGELTIGRGLSTGTVGTDKHASVSRGRVSQR